MLDSINCGNLGPESSISESKVQAQGPAIPKCLGNVYHCKGYLLLVVIEVYIRLDLVFSALLFPWYLLVVF